MPSTRRKIETVKNDFLASLARYEKIDNQNQVLLGEGKLKKWQLHLFTETVFFNSYRDFEVFLRDCFLLYCLGHQAGSRKKVVSYLNAKDFLHAEKLIQSSMPFLDWTEPDTIIGRAELYLKDGYPIKLPISTHKTALRDYKKIRNHIAHSSEVSLAQYKKTVTVALARLPLEIPRPGDFLLMSDRSRSGHYHLQSYFELLGTLAAQLA